MIDPDDAPSRAELTADRIADALAPTAPTAKDLGYDPRELAPAGEPPRCLYGLERELLAHARRRVARAARGAPVLTLYRENTLALIHALDRLGVLRLRRLLELRLAEEDVEDADL